jgi:hypothetical protein
VTVKVAASRATSGLVDIEIYDPRGRKVAQRFREPVAFVAGTARTLAWSWYVGSTRRLGVYTVKIGVFGRGWVGLLAWNDRARRFTVAR